jgi:hypothetical protein
MRVKVAANMEWRVTELNAGLRRALTPVHRLPSKTQAASRKPPSRKQAAASQAASQAKPSKAGKPAPKSPAKKLAP